MQNILWICGRAVSIFDRFVNWLAQVHQVVRKDEQDEGDAAIWESNSSSFANELVLLPLLRTAPEQ